MGRRRWRGASTPTPFLLLHPLQPHTHSASIGLSQKTRIYRRKKRTLDCVFCVGRAVAKNAHLPSQKTRSGSCFLRRSVLPSQKTLINVQIYAPSGITWVTVAKNAPPKKIKFTSNHSRKRKCLCFSMLMRRAQASNLQHTLKKVFETSNP